MILDVVIYFLINAIVFVPIWYLWKWIAPKLGIQPIFIAVFIGWLTAAIAVLATKII
jgi:hypothetical protein